MVESIGDFDEHVNSYSGELEKALGGLGGESSYFARRKVKVLAESLVGQLPSVICDYGSGIGALIPHLHEYFPNAQIIATDISQLSLEHLQKKYPYVQIVSPDMLVSQSCDLVVMSCVIHHIPADSRMDVLRRINFALRHGGSLCIFEHNPINPITRRIVSNCIFDEGVELITKKSLRTLMKRVGGFSRVNSGYFLFFPPALKNLVFVEALVSWLPLGGQHFARFTKTYD
jgi:SAM-dependent methyltransferase